MEVWEVQLGATAGMEAQQLRELHELHEVLPNIWPLNEKVKKSFFT